MYLQEHFGVCLFILNMENLAKITQTINMVLNWNSELELADDLTSFECS